MNGEEAGKFMQDWKFNTRHRYSFKVVDPESTPIINARLTVKQGETPIWEALTDNRGTAELYLGLRENNHSSRNASGYDFYLNNTLISDPITTYAQGVNLLTSTQVPQVNHQLELAFLVDATGSMGDEMNFLKEDLKRVIQEVESQNSSLDIFTATVFYRDTGDEYLVKKI